MRNLLASLLLFSVPAMAIDLQGHRGARGHLPENTLPAFAYAISLGVTTLELDVGVTRDGVVVVHHDRALNPDLARSPDGRWVKAPAPTILSLTFEQLRTYDVGRLRPGSEYSSRFKDQKPLDGTRIPKLADVLKLDAKVRFNIETKISPEAPQETLAPEPFARALIAEVRKAGVEKRTTIQSFDWRTLKVVEREAPLRMVLVQGVSSGERMDFTIRKAVELGVAEVRPVLAAASVARPKGERAAARREHWQKVAISACEQCGRNRIPQVHEMISVGQIPTDQASCKILLSPRAALRFSEACRRIETAVTVAAGPEAGFNAAEEAAFLDAGYVPARLGARVLRTETAALAALAALNALRGDF